MASKDTEGKKMKKNLRLFNKSEGKSLRPNEGVTLKTDKSVVEQVEKSAEKKISSKTNITGQRKVDDAVIQFDSSAEVPRVTEDSPAKQAFEKQKEQDKLNAQKIKETQQRQKRELELRKRAQEKNKKITPVEKKVETLSKAETTLKSAPAKNTQQKSNLAHVFTGIIIACALLTLALLWPYLPFNKGQIAVPGIDTNQEGLNEIVFGEEQNDVIDGKLQIDDNGFAVIDKIQENAQPSDQQEPQEEVDQEEPEPTLAPLDEDASLDQDDQPIEITSEPQEQEIDDTQNLNDDLDAYDATVNAQQPVVAYTPPASTVGTWGLTNLNTETFDIDDEDDDVTQLYLKDVCKSVYRQNANAFDYCRETSKLKKSTSASLGTQRCDGGGSCRVGDTCLLWNSDEQDNGDLKSYTATYICE